jgi:tripartite-type tricarboxylate transporter receptor subunit TctC
MALGSLTNVAHAETYPSKLIRVVVPFSAGGAVDIVGRTLAERLQAQMGQTVIVDNRPGASANIGARAVVQAAPDGYTLLVGANGLATNMTLFAEPPFNTMKDLAPISLLGNAPLVLVVAADSKITSLSQLIATGRADRNALTYASAGNGSSGHLAGALLASVGKFEALHVPYKGGAPALIDLIGGRISFMLLNPLEVVTQVKSGKLRALAVSGTKRIALLPDVPTVAEAGLPGFEAGVWWVLMAPAGTPHDIIAKLNAETRKALADPAARERLEGLGAIVTPSTPEQLGAFLQSEITKWSQVIKAANIQIE